MSGTLSRRDLLQTAPGWGLATGILLGVPEGDAQAQPPAAAPAPPWPSFPRQDARLVAEVVGAAHRDEARVRELVTAHPALANAWWDWGFGDWETPLGAASHVGRRGIAEFLLERGARIDIFATAMLGMTDVVRAFVTAQPGVQRTLGPHGIPLLAHARAGAQRAADTVAYLEQLGDAGSGPRVTPLPADRRDAVLGRFVSEATAVRLECRVNTSGQMVVEIRAGTAGPTTQNLYYLGEDEFFPSGVPSVRFRFAVEGGRARSVTIRTRDPILTAQRVEG